ncbi:hypothetical protein [Ramlibacter alkalitolerans]|uniref:Uncharacterized protein n=1 Tax=Ramlibacter alkalitolerans TaxID=2039631 RepID=A0ABS1JUV5_9BURK|nr:hypothetical protein [Ramlibacter alkalitolerans]MBL0428090.1 hypothetical protein [Ramlibacter alkalitolerans]
MPFRIPCLAAAALTCAAAVHAAPPLADPAISQEDVKAQKVRIEEQYDQSQARCKRLQGSGRDLCNEQARGERDIAVAELQLRVAPTADNDEKLRLARANASYSQALVKCRDFDSQAKRVCREDAKTSFEEAKAEARLQKEVVAQTLRSENTVRERTAAADRAAQAQFTQARQRCEALPAEGRQNCVEDAKRRFGTL